jgi:protein-L-isoaspartate O-methyltransferase
MYSAAPMADQSISTSGIRRSAVYSYLRPAIEGKRVLEVGCGTGEAAAHLIRLGAKSVMGAGSAQEAALAKNRFRDGTLGFCPLSQSSLAAGAPYDIIVIPEAEDILRGRGPIPMSGLLATLGPSGQLVCVTANGDRGDGLSYYEVVDGLTPHFSKVRMFGQTRFAAYGIAEFDEAAADLRVDSTLAEQEGEEPSHYIALAGPDLPQALGYALVQIPTSVAQGTAPTGPAVGPTGGKAPDSALADLRQRLSESEGKAEGLIRVSRAQSEEIEELRARLRRTAEARAELDDEVRRLRKALIEADESVVNLTRRTTEEMTALAQRLTIGLRGDVPPGAGQTEELRREVAARESALSERDDRIAALEVAKQEAVWRADAVEDELGRARAELASLRSEHARLVELGEQRQALAETTSAQESTAEEFQRAAAVHLEEVHRLRDAANEQASLVAELEDAVREGMTQLQTANAEVARLQKALVEVENADRIRRSRLAELEGLMLRAERTGAATNERRQQEQAEIETLRMRVIDREVELEQVRSRLRDAEAQLADARAQREAAGARLADLEGKLKEYTERERRLVELRAEAPDPEEIYERLFDLETQYQAATMAAARVPELEARVAELTAKLAQSGLA